MVGQHLADQTQGGCRVKMKAEIKVMLSHPKECQRLPINHQNLGKRGRMDSSSCSSGANSDDTLILDFQSLGLSDQIFIVSATQAIKIFSSLYVKSFSSEEIKEQILAPQNEPPKVRRMCYLKSPCLWKVHPRSSLFISSRHKELFLYFSVR